MSVTRTWRVTLTYDIDVTGDTYYEAVTDAERRLGLKLQGADIGEAPCKQVDCYAVGLDVVEKE